LRHFSAHSCSLFFGAGTATIVLKAETNPSRTSTVTLSVGGTDKSGPTGKSKKKK
jgi:hypothetical protein